MTSYEEAGKKLVIGRSQFGDKSIFNVNDVVKLNQTTIPTLESGDLIQCLDMILDGKLKGNFFYRLKANPVRDIVISAFIRPDLDVLYFEKINFIHYIDWSDKYWIPKINPNEDNPEDRDILNAWVQDKMLNDKQFIVVAKMFDRLGMEIKWGIDVKEEYENTVRYVDDLLRNDEDEITERE